MAFELDSNFASSTVATAPSPATSGTSLVVASGHGARFGAPPYNLIVFPADAQPTPENAEIIRVTARSTDTFSTIVRAQEGSSARSIVVGDRVFMGPTAKTFTDIGATSPTADEKAALVGNDGTPGSGNTYVTESGLAANGTALIAFHVASTPHLTSRTNYVTLPLTELDRAYTSSAYGNNLPGWNLTQTGFTIFTGQGAIPADSSEASSFSVRVRIGSASSGQIRAGLSYKNVADGGSMSSALTGLTAQDVSLTANTLKDVTFTATGSTATRGNLVVARFIRDGDHANDTLAATAFLHSIELAYTALV